MLSKLNHLNVGWLDQTIKSVGREASLFFFFVYLTGYLLKTALVNKTMKKIYRSKERNIVFLIAQHSYNFKKYPKNIK